MNCPDDNMFVAMIEHELDPTSFGELEAHIDSCGNCRRAVAALVGRSLAVGTPAPAERTSGDLDSLVAINDRYVIDSLLGSGGMGAVYLARDKMLGREVALKLHRAGTGNDRLQREAVAMAKLAHPNVVNVFEVAAVDDRLYVAMEYVRGGTLRDWLKTPRAWRDAVALLVEVGGGLTAAHAAGLIHRDFKPENVLVGEDGRPRVGDFGLARIGAVPHGAADGKLPADAPVTQTGAVVGTPAYMPPEQFAGGVVDARSDQFAFCVVAWEALFGARPFAGRTLEAIQLAIDKQELQRPAETEVPARVRRAIERGLARDPVDRYRDMAALLAALRDAAAPRVRTRIALAVAGAIVIGGGAIAAGAALTTRRHEAACAREADDVLALFGQGARARLQQAFAATGSPLARSAFDHTASVLDRYGHALAAQVGAVCRGRGDESSRVTAARRTCLAEHTAELAGVIDVLEHADATTILQAPNAAWAIYDRAPCDDLRALLAAPVGPAASPEQAAKLARARAMNATGRYAEGATLAQSLVDTAGTDRALELSAVMLLGEIREELGAAEDVAPLFHRAEALAEADGREAEAAAALVRLASLAGVEQHDYVTAHRFIDLARAKLDRLGGGDLALRGVMLATEAAILMDENRLGEADAAARQAVTVIEQTYGPEDPKLGSALGTLSEILRGEGKHAEALDAARRTLQILEAALGPDHPTVAGSEMNLASALMDAGNNADARERLLRAEAVFAKAFGPDHATHAAIFANLAEIEQAAQHWDAALVDYRKALGVLERIGNVGGQAGAHRDIARTLAGAGRLDEALVEGERSVQLLESLGADGDARIGGAIVDLAEIQLAREQPRLALPVAERALALAASRPADANPDELADARFIVARALWDSHGDRSRARTLAEQATAGHSDPDKRAAIDAWLGTHAVR